MSSTAPLHRSDRARQWSALVVVIVLGWIAVALVWPTPGAPVAPRGLPAPVASGLVPLGVVHDVPTRPGWIESLGDREPASAVRRMPAVEPRVAPDRSELAGADGELTLAAAAQLGPTSTLLDHPAAPPLLAARVPLGAHEAALAAPASPAPRDPRLTNRLGSGGRSRGVVTAAFVTAGTETARAFRKVGTTFARVF